MRKLLIIPIFCFLGIYASNAQSIIGLTPLSATQGETLTVDITGQNTNFGQGTSTTYAWFQQGSSTIISPYFTSINSSTAMSCGFTFSCSNPIGVYDLIVSNSIDGYMVLPNIFTVNYGTNHIQLSITTTDESGVGANDGMAETVVTNGNPPYGYLWNTFATTSSISNLAPGVYTCTVTDADLCTTGGTGVVQAFQCSLTGTMASTDETSPGANDGTATVMALGGSAPYGYLWDNFAITANITGLAPGFYGVTVTDANGCTYSSSAAVNPSGCTLSATVTGTNESQAGASDGTATALVTGGTAATIVWIPGGQITNFISGLAPGDYTALVTDATGCFATATYTVTAGLIIGVFEQPAPVVSVNVYPNPATGFINFEIDGADRAMLYVLDFAGRQVKEIAINQLLTEVYTADLNNGVYFYQLIGMNSDHLGSGKFVIQK